jgi:hypothetical protein
MNRWLGAAANLITGSDLTNLDELGMQLLTSQASVDASLNINASTVTRFATIYLVTELRWCNRYVI